MYHYGYYLAMLVLGMAFSCGVYARPNEKFDVYPDWKYYGDMSNSLYEHLYTVASRQLNDRQAVLSSLKTKDDWIQRQCHIRETLVKIVGSFPEKTPLNPVITGKIRKDGFVVEKLYFESRPGCYVTAALFVPSGGKKKKPAILYCSGHSEMAFRHDSYQKCILNFVKKGFVVLAFDPFGQGERYQYFDVEGKTVFGATHEHAYPGTQSFLSGLSPANYFIWDGIRALDYLISRREVDPLRIGVTGRSGGGTQSAYIAAMDERVAAAASECYLTSFDLLLRSHGPQDAEQNLMHALKEGFDMGDLIEVRAPKPFLMVSTTRDIFSIQGARDVFREAQHIYAVYGRPENLLMAEDDAGHECTIENSRATYAFFQQHLHLPGDSEEMEVETLDEKELWVTPRGQIRELPGMETLFTLNKKHTAAVLEKLREEQKNYPLFLESLRARVIELSGYRKPVSAEEHIFSGRHQYDGYAVEKYLVRGQGGYYLPVLRLTPGKETKGIVLLLDDRGKAHAIAEGPAEQLVQEGYDVFVPDLSGAGELGGGYKGGDAVIQGTPLNVWYAGVLTGKTPLAIRMEEIDVTVDFIRHLTGHQAKITGVAVGTFGTDLLHAAVTSLHFERIALVRPLISFLSIVLEKDYRTQFIMSAVPGMVGRYDLPDLAAAIAPVKVLMLHPVDASGEKVNRQTSDAVYSKAKERFLQTGYPQNFTVDTDRPDEFADMVQWLLKDSKRPIEQKE
jgi:cephalosporin-C deacetylase-like acetyl esterase